MSQFAYTAKNIDGQAVKGTVEAPNLETASDVLREKALIVLSLREKTQQIGLDSLRNLISQVSHKEVTFFARQLAVMIGATIPMVRSLRALTRQTNNEYFKIIIANIASDVDGGAKLSQALGQYPKIFDPFFIHMIRSGETTGRLDRVLEYLATQKEKDYNLHSRVRGALIYPTFILSVMLIVGVLMMIFVVPPLADILTQAGAKLPVTTQILLNTSYVFRHYWWLILLMIILVGFILWSYVRTPHGRYLFDYGKIKLPIIGPLYQRIALSRFCISLSNLLGSGVTLPTSLGIVGDIMNNVVYHDIIRHTIREVESGNTISSSFVHYGVIPPIVSQMVSVGEETGRLDDILDKLGQFYTREVDTALSTLTSLIEPVVIVILGLGAGVIVSGILMPIYNATTTIA